MAPARDELLKSILARPHDLDARLVYADHLLELGDARGRFIAEQIALGRLDPRDEGYASLLASTHRLLAQHGAEWLGDVIVVADAMRRSTNFLATIDRLLDPVFEDGFLRRVAMPETALDEWWPKLRAREPLLHGLELVLGQWLDEDRARCPPADLRRLKLNTEEHGHLVPALMERGMPLEELDLSGCFLGPSEIDSVARHLGGLRSLRLGGCPVDDRGAARLFESEAFVELRELGLDHATVRGGTLAVLRRDSRLGLRRLGLGGRGLREAPAVLAGWPALRELDGLRLPATTSVAELRALFPDPSPNLRELGASGAAELARAPHELTRVSTGLTSLDLSRTSLERSGLEAISHSPYASTLLALDVSGCDLTDEAVEALARSPLDRLVELDLSANRLSMRAVRALAGWRGLAHVTTLNLRRNPGLGVAALEPLLAHPTFAPVRVQVDRAATVPASLRERFGPHAIEMG